MKVLSMLEQASPPTMSSIDECQDEVYTGAFDNQTPADIR